MDIEKIKTFKPNKYQHGGSRGGGVGGLDHLENHKLLCFLRNTRIDPLKKQLDPSILRPL